MRRWAPPLAAAALAGALELVILSDGVAADVALVAWIPTIVLIGATGGAVRGTVVAAALLGVSVGTAYLVDGSVPAPPPGGCDPSCGLSTAGALIVLAPLVVALTGLGVLLRKPTARWCRRQAST